MRKTNIIIGAVVVLSLIFVTAPWAQRGMGPGRDQERGWGTGGAYGRIYNPQTIETLSGEVVSLDKFIPDRGMSYGVHLTVKTDKETIPVHLGPSWYLDKQDIKIVPKDQVQVTGSRVTFEEKPAIIAAEVKKGDKVLKLWDRAGVPVWAGQGRR